MVYLDYSATTKADKKVIDRFVETEEKFFTTPILTAEDLANAIENGSI